MCVTYILLHISTIYHALHSVVELKKNDSFEIRNSVLKYFVHPDQNLFAFHTPYIASDPVRFELENSRGP